MEQDVKYMFSILIYFLILIFIVTVVNGVSADFNLDTSYNYSGGQSEYTTFSPQAGNPRLSGLETGLFTTQWEVQTSIEPKYLIDAGLIYDNASCEFFNGFEWVEETSFLGFTLISATCKGQLNMTEYDSAGNLELVNLPRGRVQLNDSICFASDVYNSRYTAEKLGCTWYDSSAEYQVENGKSSFSVVWESLKDIATFDLSFPIQNSFLNFMINFILIGIPFLWLTVIIIIIIRKLVGFT